MTLKLFCAMQTKVLLFFFLLTFSSLPFKYVTDDAEAAASTQSPPMNNARLVSALGQCFLALVAVRKPLLCTRTRIFDFALHSKCDDFAL